ncbi:MAG: hypothetical protein AB7F89_02080 [Pirellulaceae bacterium]
MAKKSGKGDRENKSQSIRDYIQQNSDAGPTAVAKALNEAHGWNISAAYVSTIKNKMQEKSSPKRRGRVPSAAGGLSENTLLQAKKLADEMGGIEKAKAALDLISRLTS